MNDKEKIAKNLQILYSALEIAREGLGLLTETNPIAKKTLEEIDKMCNKIWEEQVYYDGYP